MKLTIVLNHIVIKNKASKDTAQQVFDILALMPKVENCFQVFLSKNPHFHTVKKVTFTLTLCGRAKIKKLNHDYRQKDYVTDVLSFPIYDNIRPDKKVKERLLAEIDLGDIVICKDVAKSQAREFGITFEEEIIHLLVHGLLHLLGFDHEISDKEEEIMEAYESELVIKIYKKLKKQ